MTAKGCFKNNTTQIFPDMENVLGAVVLFRMVTGTVLVVSGWARGSTVENNSQKNALRMKGITDNGPGGLIRGCYSPGFGTGTQSRPFTNTLSLFPLACGGKFLIFFLT